MEFEASVPRKLRIFKCRGTFIAFSNYMLYKIIKNLGKRTPKNWGFKISGYIFVAFIYYVVFSSNRFNEMYPDFESFLYIGVLLLLIYTISYVSRCKIAKYVPQKSR